ncbi:cytochrome-c peroxidase [Dyella tabacisoli]|uniref:Cytochrome c family protein n=1 Tax=Dyella tabacisoli TaxID=2282381 RepID=A0A369URN2_9GAMM|nr:cytochrome c peroxidase [Dyella tabacisoli]RDD80979.1 cytochrome c family protein [Dyella tabacisoli]
MGFTALSALLLFAVALKGDAANRHAAASPQIALRIALGKQLFNDPRLSADGKISCASCHIPAKAYTDGRRVAIGVYGRTGTRNTPSLAAIEISKNVSFFWEGRRTTLEQAVIDPLTNPMEMGLQDKTELIQKVEQNSGRLIVFAQAFPEAKVIGAEQVSAALTDYVRSLNSPESAYDRYTLQGDRRPLNPQAQFGLALFRGKGRCADCHLLAGSPVLLTDHAYHRTGGGLNAISQYLPSLTEAVIQRSLQGEAIGNRVATHEDEAQLGRFNVTRDPADIGLFRTPSLRGVALTAPYMHDGSIPTLEDAIDQEVYYRGLQAGYPLNMSVEERTALKAFLETL